MTQTPHAALMVDEKALDHLSAALDAYDRARPLGGPSFKYDFDVEAQVIRNLIADARRQIGSAS